MQLRHRVSLNGIQLDAQDSRILIKGIEEVAAKDQISTVSLWGADGSRVTGQHRDSLDVKITFQIRLKKKSMAERETVIEKVNAWAAGGGTLMLNYKEERILTVILAEAAAVGDPWNWTGEHTLTFRAHGIPYWQQQYAAMIRQTIDNGSVTLGVSGSARSVMDAEFKNTSNASCGSFKLTWQGRKIQLDNLGLGVNETLVIDHDDNGKRCLLRIRIRNTSGVYRSAMSCRTTDSADDLWVDPGSVAIGVNASKSGLLILSCAGRYL